jgi:hypothetical protein
MTNVERVQQIWQTVSVAIKKTTPILAQCDQVVQLLVVKQFSRMFFELLGELMKVGQDVRYGNRVGLILDGQRIDWLQDCQGLNQQITKF